ncbi:hypothetical protein E2C01_004996 [Portunus trituberculatus]|uniref:Uncharacterized protein n=1 Tax=Portunus trituberculatus TaxID=210409 RepID=A0A5B7CS72_PORTR|nr:hypothetical protein [Portunus trituberculatus]
MPNTSFSYRIQPPKKRPCTPCPPCLQPRLSQPQPYTTSPLACLLLLCPIPAPSGRVDHRQAPAWMSSLLPSPHSQVERLSHLWGSWVDCFRQLLPPRSQCLPGRAAPLPRRSCGWWNSAPSWSHKETQTHIRSICLFT